MKKGNPILSRKTARLFLVVAGFLGLLLVNNGAFAQEQVIFSDDFNGTTIDPTRQDVVAVGNGVTRTQAGGLLKSSGGNWDNQRYLLQPAITGNATVKLAYTVTGDFNIVPFVAGYIDTDSPRYVGYYYANYRSFGLSIRDSSNTTTVSLADLINQASITSIPISTPLKVEFLMKIVSPVLNQLTINIKDAATDTLYYTKTVDDDNNLIHSYGQWGLATYNARTIFDSFILSTSGDTTPLPDKEITFVANKKDTIKFGESLTYTITDDEDTTIILSDNGANGIFSPSNTIKLNAGNSRKATVTYTPSQAGTIKITGTLEDKVEQVEDSFFVSPYSLAIGFIGDSITSAGGWVTNATTNLGQNFSVVRQGVSASSSIDWKNDDYQSTPILSNAITTFKTNGVEVVHTMLGTNDAALNATASDYKTNMQNILTKLKDEGFRLVILSCPIYSTHSNVTETELTSYCDVLKELADENAGFAVFGDTDAYEWFKANPTELTDKVHPTSTGYAALGKFRAEAIKANLEYQTQPNHKWRDTTNTHQLGTAGTLNYSIDKYFGDLEVVQIDNVQVATSDYVATSGSTTIELNADYLNTLAAGNHTLTVGFEGGVEVAENFTILPDPTLPPVTPPTTPTVPTTPTYVGGGGGGISLVKDSCPNGDLSPSYYDQTCGTTANMTEEVAKKVNLLRPVIKLIYLTATEEQKTFVHNLITSCSKANKNEIIKLACQELVKDWDF